MTSRDEALNLAINCIEALRSTFSDNEDVMKGFRARSRDIPSQVYYGGLTYAIAFIVAKASKDDVSGYELMNQALKNADVNQLFDKWKKGECKEDKAEKKAEEKESKKNIKCVEDEAYELYGACLMRAIKELAQMDNINDVIILLKELNEPAKQVIATNKILKFAEWLKRMAEATIPG